MQRVRYLRTEDGIQLAWAEAGTGPGPSAANLEKGLVPRPRGAPAKTMEIPGDHVTRYTCACVAAELLASLGPDLEMRDGETWIAEVERPARDAVTGVLG